ncbi:ribonuclease H-like [Macadamia integrifolia]|uniref:ribonuclease H-like n=1 Tax=Macadamia integrifolia TaxID=60698 RepID=UPI001C530F86|nr:ribonuclease H-like [Macadamia integrifolia]
MKINVDGSSLGNPGNAGAGGVLRDNAAEFEAVLEGILLARHHNARGVWIESDSASVLSAVQRREIPWFALQKWRFSIPFLESVQWKITHCFHEANVVADFQARKASKSCISEFSVEFPSHVVAELASDALDRHRFRFG